LIGFWGLCKIIDEIRRPEPIRKSARLKIKLIRAPKEPKPRKEPPATRIRYEPFKEVRLQRQQELPKCAPKRAKESPGTIIYEDPDKPLRFDRTWQEFSNEIENFHKIPKNPQDYWREPSSEPGKQDRQSR